MNSVLTHWRTILLTVVSVAILVQIARIGATTWTLWSHLRAIESAEAALVTDSHLRTLLHLPATGQPLLLVTVTKSCLSCVDAARTWSDIESAANVQLVFAAIDVGDEEFEGLRADLAPSPLIRVADGDRFRLHTGIATAPFAALIYRGRLVLAVSGVPTSEALAYATRALADPESVSSEPPLIERNSTTTVRFDLGLAGGITPAE